MIVPLLILAFVAGAFAAAAVYQGWATQRDRRRLQPPGRFLQTGNGTLYFHEQGQGSPAVLLESGLAASSLSWALVQPAMGELTKTCSYDRAGFGWSSPSSKPRTVRQMIAELRALLQSAGVPPPYILVGHSFGALLMRAFAHLHGNEVAGLILVDPVSIRYWSRCGRSDRKRLQLGAKLSRRGAILARFGVVRLSLLLLAKGRTRLPQFVARTSSGKANALLSRLTSEVRKLPPSVWPFLCAHWSRSYSFQTMAAYLQNLPQNAQEASHMEVPAHIPLTVVSAANATEGELQERETWVKHSRQGRHIRLDEGGHWIQLEYPQTVIAIIRELVHTANLHREEFDSAVPKSG